MNDSERNVFDDSIKQCYDMYDAVPKDLGVWWTACHRYELTYITKALMAHMQDPQWGNQPPKPAQIIGRLARFVSDGHLPADEAWAIAIQAMDEDETVVWTQEIVEAWACAKLVMAAGDEVGARMAFRSAYERRLSESRAAGQFPKWFPSLGHDTSKRAAALADAADRLRLPYLAEQGAIEDRSRQSPSPQSAALVAAARRIMRMQAPRQGNETPLDEIVAALAENPDARRKALADMNPVTEQRVRQALISVEKSRQLDAAYRAMTPKQRAEFDYRPGGMAA